MFVLDRKQHLSKYWFLYGIFLSIMLAFIYPNFGSKDGPLKPDWTIKLFGTMLIFFLNGCSIRSEVNNCETKQKKYENTNNFSKELYKTLLQYRIHVFIQIFSFAICPFVFLILSTIYRFLTYQYQLSLG